MNSKQTQSHWSASVLIPIFTAISFSGCGGPVFEIERAAVHGMVTLDGKELQQGMILFIPIEGTAGPKTSLEIKKGTFDIEAKFGPPVGKHRIEITSTDTAGYAMDDENAIQKLREAGVKKLDVQTVPATYHKNSQLVKEITLGGQNELIFELKSKTR